GPEAALGIGRLLQYLVLEPPRLLAVDLAAVHVDAEGIGLAVAIALISLGPGDQVTLARHHALEHEGVGEALDAMWLGLGWLGMRLAGVGRALRADSVLCPHQREEIAELRRVDHDGRVKAHPPSIVQIHGEDTLHAIRAHQSARRFGSGQNDEPARFDERLRHGVKHVDGHPRLEGKTRDPAPAGIWMRLRGEGGRQAAVMGADGLAQGVVASRSPEALDVLVLVQRGDALGGELTAYP